MSGYDADAPEANLSISLTEILPGLEDKDWEAATKDLRITERFEFWTDHTSHVIEHRSPITYRAFRAIWDRKHGGENEHNNDNEESAA